MSAGPAEIVQRSWAEKGVKRPNVILISLGHHAAPIAWAATGMATPERRRSTRWQRGGVLFSQAATPAPLTLPAHSSIMTGFYPTYHGVRLNGTTALSQLRRHWPKRSRSVGTRPARSSARSFSTGRGV
jgi:arylsulfatase A-like enzyme